MSFIFFGVSVRPYSSLIFIFSVGIHSESFMLSAMMIASSAFLILVGIHTSKANVSFNSTSIISAILSI